MVMKRIVILLALVTIPAHASDLGDDQRTAQFVNKLMTATMLCEKAVGRAHYQAARTMAVASLTKYLGDAEAHKAVKGIEDRLKNDPRMAKIQKNADANKCLETMNDLYFEYGDLK